MTTLGEHLITLLTKYGVDTVFGIPGVHTVELYRGLETSTIRHITPRHEQGAGFMADGYARMTGKPGVCLVISGPGLSNIATAMLQARADSIPMLVLSAVNATGHYDSGRGYLHEMPDQRGFAGEAALFSRTIQTPQELPEALARAFAIFSSARPGPVHLEIPLNVMTEIVEPDALKSYPLPSSPAIDPISLGDLAQRCSQARKPVILAGGGVSPVARDDLRQLAEKLDAPVITTINGRRLMAPDHPLHVPFSPSLEEVRALVDDADLVLAFGTEMGRTDYDMYDTGRSVDPAFLARVDIDPQMLCRSIRPDLPITGDAARAIARLNDDVQQTAPSNDGAGRAKATRTKAWAVQPASYQQNIGLLEQIRALVPETVFVGDSTQLTYAGNMGFAPDTSGGWFNSATGFGTLGYALGAALGAKAATPSHHVLCMMGDGGIQFTLGELGVAIDHDLPITILVWDNAGYGEIKSYMVNRQIKPEGVNLTPPDFVKLAESYGFDTEQVTDMDSLPDAIKKVADRNRPALIHYRVSRS
ncbi:5-guanidino-2-oxopentanoate decarboxylase [Coralliovum pocilloporae]|uniref:5-guanidino-2-oxopentanoate decarboxylase n=1 Tax=Coralliovum pocilloporae TaxID=3066369 RepID=UPI003307A4CB